MVLFLENAVKKMREVLDFCLKNAPFRHVAAALLCYWWFLSHMCIFITQQLQEILTGLENTLQKKPSFWKQNR